MQDDPFTVTRRVPVKKKLSHNERNVVTIMFILATFGIICSVVLALILR